MKKILYLTLLSLFLTLIFNCFPSAAQQKVTAAPTQKQSTQQPDAQGQSVKDKEATVKSNQTRIEELAKKTGLQSIKPIALVDFELEDLNGNMHKLSAYKGKVVFLNFWATWCPPCKAEMPDLQKLYENFKGKNFQMLAVDSQESKSTVANYIKNKSYTFPILLDTKGTIGRKYGAESIPLSIIIDKKGFLVYGAVGGRAWASPDVLELIDRLINQPE